MVKVSIPNMTMSCSFVLLRYLATPAINAMARNRSPVPSMSKLRMICPVVSQAVMVF